MPLIGLTVRSRQCGSDGVSDTLTGGGRDVDPELPGTLSELVIECERGA